MCWIVGERCEENKVCVTMSRMTSGRDKTLMDTQRTNFLKEVYTKEEQYVCDGDKLLLRFWKLVLVLTDAD